MSRKMSAAQTCKKCGAVQQEHEVREIAFRLGKEGPPEGDGWKGPLYPNAAVQIYERFNRETYFDCKFVCPNQTTGRAAIQEEK